MNPTGYPTASSTNAIHRDIGPATPRPMGEIDRELGVQAELCEMLVSELSTLAATLEPVLMPAPDGKGSQPANPCGSLVAGRISDHNNRIAYAIEVVRNLRNGVAL